jgi:hypothetical protein
MRTNQPVARESGSISTVLYNFLLLDDKRAGKVTTLYMHKYARRSTITFTVH